MRSFMTGAIIFGVSLSLTACATRADYNLLDAGARQHIKTVDGVLIAKQKQVGADINQNSQLSNIANLSALITGIPIVPMLVDVGVTGTRTLEANKMAKPMREALEGHDYPWEFRKQVKQSLARTTLNDLDEYGKMTIIRDEAPGFRASFIQDSEADAVLIVDMKYAFSASFDKLYIASAAMLFPNNDELRRFQETPDKDNTIEYSDNIYRNQFSASLSTGKPGASKVENAAFWAELSESQLIDVLERVGLSMADAIANDIGLDDLDSDLDLIPEGYVLNTEYSNLNKLSNSRLPDSEIPNSSDIPESSEDRDAVIDGNGS